MKITKNKFIRILARQVSKKLGSPLEATALNTFTLSIVPIVDMYKEQMVRKEILDLDNNIDISKLSNILNEFFTTFPTINVPITGTVIAITKVDAIALIKELEKQADIDEIIYLPYQN